MEIVRTQDTGTLQYDTSFNDEETECIVIERFRDSDALIQAAGTYMFTVRVTDSLPQRTRTW